MSLKFLSSLFSYTFTDYVLFFFNLALDVKRNFKIAFILGQELSEEKFESLIKYLHIQ